MKNYKALMAGLLLVLTAQTARAQYAPVSKPYLVAAAIDIAVDAQADVWLNGIHIAHCPHTAMGGGYKTVIARPDSLCYFKTMNVLAIRVEAAKGSQGDGFIGVAYAFRFKLSDGTFRVVSSSSPEEHRCLYISHWDIDEPEDWRELDFDDSHWAIAQNSGDMIPNTASLSGGDFGGVADFLTATSAGYAVQNPGEKQLFRRRFNLDIGVNPRCYPKSFLAPPSRSWSNEVPNSHPAISITPEVLDTHREPLASSPNLNHPVYQPAPSVWRYQQIWPTFTPTPVVYLPPVSMPMAAVPATATPIPSLPNVTMPVYTPTAIPTMVVQDDGSIVFGESNANILVTFGDGPGVYKVEAVNVNFGHLKTLFNQYIMTNSEMWLTWDGKDDNGQDVPEGRYYILCSKEGIVLQKILLRRVP